MTKLRNKKTAPVGSIEPIKSRLTLPSDDQLLYKVMTVENLLRSIVGDYLHFNRVDSYGDFPGADHRDGEQPPKDRKVNEKSIFKKSSGQSLGFYYDKSRERTYACCFSLEDLDSNWQNYGNDSKYGKVCIVFNFGKLRKALNLILHPGNCDLQYYGESCRQIFSISYGIVRYEDLCKYQANSSVHVNPIEYAFLKDEKFSEEKEFRIVLSAFGMGTFSMGNGDTFEFPRSLTMGFDFKTAISDGTILKILQAADCKSDFLRAELKELRIVPAP